ncbi:conserved hypothetical protein [Paecilomyces variotii No. 5]|uniref:Fungal N-terminal domain-containing protein n=1 Tax=Byssochlamys spectabilis (strain No. 5 / NBRC 109023) TaxID=1356009 RepID=V5FZI3_BYSSN|nr:conserved hypothetical protein [Paecilomyces variotii No. 5]
MEAIGAAAAIIQLAGVGLALAQTLYKICDEGLSRNKQVEELSSYVRSTSVALEEVGKIFEEEGRMANPIISTNAITTVNDVVAKCTEIFSELDKIVKGARDNAVGALVFAIKGSQLRVLQTRLERSKIDLQLMMQVIVYARVKIGPGSTRDESNQSRITADLIYHRDKTYQKNRRAENHLEGEVHA